MMWDNGYGVWWMIIPSVLLTVLIAAGVVALVMALARRPASSGSGRPGDDSARRIAEERLARGELTPEQFREIVGLLAERPRPQ